MTERERDIHDSDQSEDCSIGLPAFATAACMIVKDVGREFDFHRIGFTMALESAAVEGFAACQS